MFKQFQQRCSKKRQISLLIFFFFKLIAFTAVFLFFDLQCYEQLEEARELSPHFSNYNGSGYLMHFFNCIQNNLNLILRAFHLNAFL